MKITKSILTLALTAAFLTSCEKQEDANEFTQESSQTTAVSPELPSILNTANKGGNSYYTQLNSINQLEGAWKLNYILRDGQWNLEERTGVDIGFFAGSILYSTQILEFDAKEVKLSTDIITTSKGKELPALFLKKYPLQKTEAGFSIGTENINSIFLEFWKYEAYTCWNGKGLMVIPILENSDSSLGLKATPHFFVKKQEFK